ncbi:hypothetical protein Ga0100231_024725 [Opitutaceae bacterium TAV4]|nr:hypothetical protein Ga0100231_024725 [Opitutaceae bacterium TAV4]RRK00926.1 hypothetical protein Ga0100230_024455 [Opitutaceae bacterium TAV3]
MKAAKVFMTSMLVISSASMAFAADIELRITGATAFRASSHQAIVNLITPATLEVAYVGSSLNGAGRAIFRGTSVANSSDTLTIKTSWSGSIRGIQSVASGGTVNPVTDWLANANLTGTPGIYQLATPISVPLTPVLPAHAALADNSQGETPYNHVNDSIYADLDGGPVGATPFVWVKGTHADATKQARLNLLTNITSQQAQLVLKNGAPFSFFSDTPSDSTYRVYALGRNVDSGTRLAAFAETFLDSLATFSASGIAQYQATVSGNRITGITLWTPSSNGYSSGGTLATALSNQVTSSENFFLVSYLSLNDAATLPNVTFNTTTGEFTPTNPALPFPILTFNGSAHTYSAVREGRYSFWNFEYFLYNGNILTPGEQGVVDELITEITTNTASVAGLKLDENFRVIRAAAGLYITD